MSIDKKTVIDLVALDQKFNQLKERFHAAIKDDVFRGWAQDNIHEILQPGDTELIKSKATIAVASLLDALLIDWRNDPNSFETPQRIAKMYVDEIMRGRYEAPPVIASFPNRHRGQADGAYPGGQVVPAEIKSVCSHHHQTVSGVAYIGVLPGDQLMGLSKFTRIAQNLAQRGTLQEDLTQDIVDEVKKASGTEHVACIIFARHGCCENRGIRSSNSEVSTMCLSGYYYRPGLRNEFMQTVTMLHSRRNL